ncbi:unnamed protein product [Notodromas monacha]|uniref:SHSP domain-containing protein n=1 Tax=Notodromas monacha TaxID=399045 RepID=A0A7R9BXC5_9CRUS|nr:unnamed protein product [Notodromas monacha]CAG0922538.1 unnamed protein product [Notodromas monacha]
MAFEDESTPRYSRTWNKILAQASGIHETSFAEVTHCSEPQNCLPTLDRISLIADPGCETRRSELRMTTRLRSGVSNVSNDRSKFQIMLDVQQFCPNEISVKTVDNYIVIEGKHEEKEDDHGYVARHFVRRYLLPKGVRPESVTSTISCDGVLTVAAPKESSGSCEIRQVAVTPVNKPVLCSTCPTGVCGLERKSIHEAPRTSLPMSPVSPKAAATGPDNQQQQQQQQPCITVCASSAAGAGPNAAQIHISPSVGGGGAGNARKS